MKIRIISGGYGRRTGCGTRLMTPSSPPFDVTAAEGARLISAGVAEEVCEETAETPMPTAADYDGMTAAQLRVACAARGIPVKPNTAAEKMRALLIAADAEADDDVDAEAGDEAAEAPMLTPAAPVLP